MLKTLTYLVSDIRHAHISIYFSLSWTENNLAEIKIKLIQTIAKINTTKNRTETEIKNKTEKIN